MLAGLALAVFQRLIGVNTVIYYSATIFKFTGLSANASIERAVFVGITNVVFTIIAIALLDRTGRRPLLLVGTAAAVLGLVGLGFFFYITPRLPGGPADRHAAVIHRGLRGGSRPGVLADDLGDLPARRPQPGDEHRHGCELDSELLRLVLLLAARCCDRQGWHVLVYAGLGIVAITYFSWRIPETKSRSLEEIERELGAGDAAQAEAA